MSEYTRWKNKIVNILYPELQETLLQYIPKDIINHMIVPMLCPVNPFENFNYLPHISSIQSRVFLPSPLGCWSGEERNDDETKEKEIDFQIDMLKRRTTEPYFITLGSHEDKEEFREEFKAMINRRGYHMFVLKTNWAHCYVFTIICPSSHKKLIEENADLLLKTYFFKN